MSISYTKKPRFSVSTTGLYYTTVLREIAIAIAIAIARISLFKVSPIMKISSFII